MNRRAVAAFARRFGESLERNGIASLDRFDWPGGFFGLGFEMDCGHAYEEAYGLGLGNDRDIGEGLSRVDDMAVLGRAIFSRCRYLTHWSGGYGEEGAAGLVAALGRLEELAGSEDASGTVVAYRFKGARRLRGRGELRHRPARRRRGPRDRGGPERVALRGAACERVPWATVARATRVVEDEETGDDVALSWDDERGRWELSGDR